MSLSLRFILPLILALAAMAYGVLPLVDQLTLRWFVRDLDIRAGLVTNSLQEPLYEQLRAGKPAKTQAYLTRLIQDERLFGLGFCPQGGTLIATKGFPAAIGCDSLARFDDPAARLLQSEQGPLHVAVHPIAAEGEMLGKLVLVHDMSFIQRRSEETKRYVFYFFVGLGLIVSLITVIIAQLSWRGWIRGMRALLRGEGLLREPERPYGSIRRYSQADIDRVRFIKVAQRIGFTLDEVAQLLQLEDGAHCSQARNIAEQKLAEIRLRLTDLQRIESVLADLVERCAHGRGKLACPLIAAIREAA